MLYSALTRDLSMTSIVVAAIPVLSVIWMMIQWVSNHHQIVHLSANVLDQAKLLTWVIQPWQMLHKRFDAWRYLLYGPSMIQMGYDKVGPTVDFLRSTKGSLISHYLGRGKTIRDPRSR